MDRVNLSGFLFGNINEEGVLEDDDFLDQEVRSALNTITRQQNGNGGPRELGLNLDTSFMAMTTSGGSGSGGGGEMSEASNSNIIEKKVTTLRIDYTKRTTTASEEEESIENDESKHSQSTAPAPAQSFDVNKLKLSQRGQILRYTALLGGKPAYGRGRYRGRPLRVKRRKMALRPVIFQEDSLEYFRKPMSINQITKPSFNNKTNLYHQILSGLNGSSLMKRGVSNLDFYEAESIAPGSIVKNYTYVSNPLALNDFPIEGLITHPVELLPWEDSITWDQLSQQKWVSPFSKLYAGTFSSSPPSRQGSVLPGSRPQTPSLYFNSMQSSRQASLPTSRSSTPLVAPRSIAGRILNVEFASGNWVDRIVWDLSSSLQSVPVQLNLNDPSLILETVDMTSLTEKLIKTERLIQKRLKKLRHHGTTSDGKSLVIQKYDKPVADRFNVSNDKQYEVGLKGEGSSISAPTKSARSARVMTSSRIGVQHSIPALKLSMPYYKTFLTKTDLRSWHRPKIEVMELIGKAITFDRPPKSKDRKDSTTTARTTGIIATSKQLSLRERASEYVLVEYTEEFPLIMMNPGMATFLLNFYRKHHPKDSHEGDSGPGFGLSRILEPNEASPFWSFGDIRPGDSLACIQNNLFRAPLFEHSPGALDFLCLKFNVKGQVQSKYFLKELPPQLLAAGQVFPTMEVFGPHSRKHNVFCRSRIQSFAYRLFRKDERVLSARNSGDPSSEPRLKINRIMAAFPQFSEGSLRKWLKEYSDSIRSGQDSGTWRLRKDAPNLNEDDLRALVTPEMVCQYESMLAGQQRLNDAGFMDSPEMEVEREIEKESDILESEDSKVRLAPWNLSMNFISATLGKCTLELHGVGDPTSRGEGFSFVKAQQQQKSSLSIPSATNDTISSAQSSSQGQSGSQSKPPVLKEQLQYKQEIVRIWEAQAKALRASGDDTAVKEPTDSFAVFEEDETASVTSKSSSTRFKDKKLIIRRTIQDPVTLIEREEVEVITSLRLLTAYMNQRRVWERKRRRREIAAAASAARAKKARPEGERPPPKPKSVSLASSKPKKLIQVKCGTCQAVGHMRTNRICPRYSEYEEELKRQEEAERARHEARESAGFKIEGAKISFSKSLLESATSAPVPPLRLKLALDQRGGGLEVGRLNEKFSSVISQLMSEPDAWPFNKPVNRAEYPQYYMIITHPMDFGTIKGRIKKCYYRKTNDILDDMKLIRDNCIQFNGPDHPFSITISRLVDKGIQALDGSEHAAVAEDPHVDITIE